MKPIVIKIFHIFYKHSVGWSQYKKQFRLKLFGFVCPNPMMITPDIYFLTLGSTEDFVDNTIARGIFCDH